MFGQINFHILQINWILFGLPVRLKKYNWKKCLVRLCLHETVKECKEIKTREQCHNALLRLRSQFLSLLLSSFSDWKSMISKIAGLAWLWLFLTEFAHQTELREKPVSKYEPQINQPIDCLKVQIARFIAWLWRSITLNYIRRKFKLTVIQGCWRHDPTLPRFLKLHK